MKGILIGASFLIFGTIGYCQDSIQSKWVRFELIPFSTNFFSFQHSEINEMPYSVHFICNTVDKHAFDWTLLQSRMLIKKRFILGARLSLFDFKIDSENVLENLKENNPNYYIESNRNTPGYSVYEGIFSAGLHLQLIQNWYIECLVNYRLTSTNFNEVSYVFKENQSNNYFINRYSAQEKNQHNLAFELNIMRYSKSHFLRRIFYGAQFCVGKHVIKNTIQAEQSTISGIYNKEEIPFSKRINYFSVGLFLGFKLFKC